MPEPPGRTEDARAKLMLVLLCIIWGVSWPVMRIALKEIPPFSMRTASAGLGALALYLVCLGRGRSLRIPDAKAWAHVIVASLLNIAVFSLFTAFAQLATSTSRVAILVYTLPIWSVLLAWPLLGERPSRMQTAALGLCAAGLAILIYPLAAVGVPVGVLFALAAALSWGAGTVYLKWARIAADPMGVACLQIAIAFVALALATLVFEGGPHFGAAGRTALVATVLNGVVSNGLAYGLWFASVRRLSAVTASLGVLSVPVIGVIAAMVMLGEVPTATDIVGFAFIFAASACTLLSRDLSAQPASPTT